MICPQCGEQKNLNHTFAGAILPGQPFPVISGASCGACGCKWQIGGVIEEIDEAVVGELLEATQGPGLLTGAADELPGIVFAVAHGDMEYITDERTEWMIEHIRWLRMEIIRVCALPEGVLLDRALSATTAKLEDNKRRRGE